MDNPLISICIPTNKRAPYIKECLASLIPQFADRRVSESVEVIVLDNQSNDGTEEIVQGARTRCPNISYVCDTEKRKIIPGIVKAAGLAKGDYIWVFSDDDIQTPNCLITVLDCLKKSQPDLVVCNLSSFSTGGSANKHNQLEIEEDVVLQGRRRLFDFLNQKFPTAIDHYTTFCSNWLLSRNVFEKNFSFYGIYNGPLDLFPLPSLVFYGQDDIKTAIIAKDIILARADNQSWGKKNFLAHFFFHDRVWKDYYAKIIVHNREFIPDSFIRNVRLKNLLRKFELPKLIIIRFLIRLGIKDQLKKLLGKK